MHFRVEVVRFRFLRIAIPVPWGYFGGIGTQIGIKRIVKGIEKCFPVPIPHFTIGQKELQFTIPKFEESCHLYFRVLLRVFDEPVCEVGGLCEDGGSDVGVAVKVPRHDAAQHSWARQHAWLSLSFFPFPVGHPPHPPCT